MHCLEKQLHVISHYHIHRITPAFLSNHRSWRRYMGFTCWGNLEAESPEPKSSVYVQNRCAARQQGWSRPSTFSCPPFRLPSIVASLRIGKHPHAQPVSFCQRRLACSPDCKHLTTAKSSEHVKSFDSHPSRGDGEAKDMLVISLVLLISTPHPQACLQHIFGSCVRSFLASAVWETFPESQSPHGFSLLKCATGFHMRVSNPIQGVIYRLLSSPTAVFSSPRCSHF